MDGEFILALVSRWIHVGTVIVLVGGTCFMKFVAGPVLKGQAPEIMDAMRGRWKKIHPRWNRFAADLGVLQLFQSDAVSQR